MIPSRSSHRSRRAAGLTLVELVVAVATGAILVVMVGSVLLASTRAADSIVKESSARKVNVILRRITESLRRSALDLPPAADVKRLVVHQKDTAGRLALRVAERIDINTLRPTALPMSRDS